MNNLKQMIKVASEEQEKKGLPWGKIGLGVAGLGAAGLAAYGMHKGFKGNPADHFLEGKFHHDTNINILTNAFRKARDGGLTHVRPSGMVHDFLLSKSGDHIVHDITHPDIAGVGSHILHSKTIPLNDTPEFIKNNLKNGRFSISHTKLDDRKDKISKIIKDSPELLKKMEDYTNE